MIQLASSLGGVSGRVCKGEEGEGEMGDGRDFVAVGKGSDGGEAGGCDGEEEDGGTHFGFGFGFGV